MEQWYLEIALKIITAYAKPGVDLEELKELLENHHHTALKIDTGNKSVDSNQKLKLNTVFTYLLCLERYCLHMLKTDSNEFTLGKLLLSPLLLALKAGDELAVYNSSWTKYDKNISTKDLHTWEKDLLEAIDRKVIVTKKDIERITLFYCDQNELEEIKEQLQAENPSIYQENPQIELLCVDPVAQKKAQSEAKKISNEGENVDLNSSGISSGDEPERESKSFDNSTDFEESEEVLGLEELDGFLAILCDPKTAAEKQELLQTTIFEEFIQPEFWGEAFMRPEVWGNKKCIIQDYLVELRELFDAKGDQEDAQKLLTLLGEEGSVVEDDLIKAIHGNYEHVRVSQLEKEIRTYEESKKSRLNLDFNDLKSFISLEIERLKLTRDLDICEKKILLADLQVRLHLRTNYDQEALENQKSGLLSFLNNPDLLLEKEIKALEELEKQKNRLNSENNNTELKLKYDLAKCEKKFLISKLQDQLGLETKYDRKSLEKQRSNLLNLLRLELKNQKANFLSFLNNPDLLLEKEIKALEELEKQKNRLNSGNNNTELKLKYDLAKCEKKSLISELQHHLGLETEYDRKFLEKQSSDLLNSLLLEEALKELEAYEEKKKELFSNLELYKIYKIGIPKENRDLSIKCDLNIREQKILISKLQDSLGLKTEYDRKSLEKQRSDLLLLKKEIKALDVLEQEKIYWNKNPQGNSFERLNCDLDICEKKITIFQLQDKLGLKWFDAAKKQSLENKKSNLLPLKKEIKALEVLEKQQNCLILSTPQGNNTETLKLSNALARCEKKIAIYQLQVDLGLEEFDASKKQSLETKKSMLITKIAELKQNTCLNKQTQGKNYENKLVSDLNEMDASRTFSGSTIRYATRVH